MNKYRCETCSHYLKYAIACDKIKERLIVGADEWIDKVGCASHSDFHAAGELLLHSPALDTIKQSEREDVLEHVDEILKREWVNADTLDNPYRDDRHKVISRIRDTVMEYRKELRKSTQEAPR